jgi:hypothetical protein
VVGADEGVGSAEVVAPGEEREGIAADEGAVGWGDSVHPVKITMASNATHRLMLGLYGRVATESRKDPSLVAIQTRGLFMSHDATPAARAARDGDRGGRGG